ncbi:hypothetical protein DSCA_04330 [Desulfosarcina alkanivorans]|uniref:Uncharacterized protein n=1 Tax=Desulfosarcina alkanivorans TaxID=571177 RepID=A0A5K7YCZ7_9BACT|nr:hypothetical protein DSCA_04330 [Desulfosarcina alkanivorans]
MCVRPWARARSQDRFTPFSPPAGCNAARVSFSINLYHGTDINMRELISIYLTFTAVLVVYGAQV